LPAVAATESAVTAVRVVAGAVAGGERRATVSVAASVTTGPAVVTAIGARPTVETAITVAELTPRGARPGRTIPATETAIRARRAAEGTTGRTVPASEAAVGAVAAVRRPGRWPIAAAVAAFGTASAATVGPAGRTVSAPEAAIGTACARAGGTTIRAVAAAVAAAVPVPVPAVTLAALTGATGITSVAAIALTAIGGTGGAVAAGVRVAPGGAVPRRALTARPITRSRGAICACGGTVVAVAALAIRAAIPAAVAGVITPVRTRRPVRRSPAVAATTASTAIVIAAGVAAAGVSAIPIGGATGVAVPTRTPIVTGAIPAT
jgi:hypothetical protein